MNCDELSSLYPGLFTPDFSLPCSFYAWRYAQGNTLGIAMPLEKPMFYSCNYINKIYHCYYWAYGNYWPYSKFSGWIELVGSQILYVLDNRIPEETCSAGHSDTEYPGETASCTRRLHWDDSTLPEQLFSRSALQQQGGSLLWMPNVICQLVGIRMVQWYVMKWGRVSVCPSCSMATVLKLMPLLLLINTIIANKKINHKNSLKKRESYIALI